MDPQVMAFGDVMQIIIISTGAFVAIGLGGRVLWRFGSRTKAAPAVASGEDSARLQRLEHAVESIAIEVERISEGQRFTVALLSDRLPNRAGDSLGAGTPKRVITPH